MAWKYLRDNVVKGRGVDNGEAKQENIRLGIRQRSEAVVVFLSRGIPQAKPHPVVVEKDIGRVVLTAGKTVSTNLDHCHQRDIEAHTQSECTRQERNRNCNTRANRSTDVSAFGRRRKTKQWGTSTFPTPPSPTATHYSRRSVSVNIRASLRIDRGGIEP
jgi:hypothetical protein